MACPHRWGRPTASWVAAMAATPAKTLSTPVSSTSRLESNERTTKSSLHLWLKLPRLVSSTLIGSLFYSGGTGTSRNQGRNLPLLGLDQPIDNYHLPHENKQIFYN